MRYIHCSNHSRPGDGVSAQKYKPYTHTRAQRKNLLDLETHVSLSNMATRWGLCSAGKISHDFAVALRTLPAVDHQVEVQAGDTPAPIVTLW